MHVKLTNKLNYCWFWPLRMLLMQYMCYLSIYLVACSKLSLSGTDSLGLTDRCALDWTEALRWNPPDRWTSLFSLEEYWQIPVQWTHIIFDHVILFLYRYAKVTHVRVCMHVFWYIRYAYLQWSHKHYCIQPASVFIISFLTVEITHSKNINIS